jgi:hypothetical protein
MPKSHEIASRIPPVSTDPSLVAGKRPDAPDRPRMARQSCANPAAPGRPQHEPLPDAGSFGVRNCGSSQPLGGVVRALYSILDHCRRGEPFHYEDPVLRLFHSSGGTVRKGEWAFCSTGSGRTVMDSVRSMAAHALFVLRSGSLLLGHSRRSFIDAAPRGDLDTYRRKTPRDLPSART